MASKVGQRSGAGLLVFAAASLVLGNISVADEGGRGGVGPGSNAPAWHDLPGVDDKRHSLADLDREKLVVVAFTCNSCPFAVSYEDRLTEFAKEYGPKGVEVVAINVNTEEEDRLPAMKVRASEKGFPFPYLFDETQAIGHAYGAKVTPHLFVLDRERKIAYVGAFDNSRRPEKVTKQYVRDAVNALLAGEKPAVTKTNATGCSIHYEEEEPADQTKGEQGGGTQ